MVGELAVFDEFVEAGFGGFYGFFDAWLDRGGWCDFVYRLFDIG